jgi:hypothetical protein
MMAKSPSCIIRFAGENNAAIAESQSIHSAPEVSKTLNIWFLTACQDNCVEFPQPIKHLHNLVNLHLVLLILLEPSAIPYNHL